MFVRWWHGAMKQIGQLAKGIKSALSRMARTDAELAAEKDKLPGSWG